MLQVEASIFAKVTQDLHLYTTPWNILLTSKNTVSKDIYVV